MPSMSVAGKRGLSWTRRPPYPHPTSANSTSPPGWEGYSTLQSIWTSCNSFISRKKLMGKNYGTRTVKKKHWYFLAVVGSTPPPPHAKQWSWQKAYPQLCLYFSACQVKALPVLAIRGGGMEVKPWPMTASSCSKCVFYSLILMLFVHLPRLTSSMFSGTVPCLPQTLGKIKMLIKNPEEQFEFADNRFGVGFLKRLRTHGSIKQSKIKCIMSFSLADRQEKSKYM